MNQQIWLSRDGKTEGPFDQAQIDQFKASGEIFKYVWIWTPESKAWSPIQMAPPPPPVPQGAAQVGPTSPPAHATPHQHVAPKAAAYAPVATPKSAISIAPSAAGTPAAKVDPAARAEIRPLAAICHDNRSVVAGMLNAQKGEIWILSTKHRLTELPPFQKGAKVWINLLDEQSGQAENAEATLMDYKKTPESWEYSLKWKTQTPRLVSH